MGRPLAPEAPPPLSGAAAVVAADGALPAWAAPLGAALLPAAALRDPVALRARLAGAACALVDAADGDALAAARAVVAADPAVQVVLVAPPAGRAALERAMLFAPGLGEPWLRAPGEVDAALVRQAGEVTAQRRRYRRTRAAIARAAAEPAPERVERALVSDAYLAELLLVLPDAVLSVDEEGRILSANPAAETLTGLSARELVGRPLRDLAAPDPDELLARARTGPAQGDVLVRRGGDEWRIAECAAVPVEAGSVRVWAVVLHDVTEQRRAQDQLEQQASELEEQAAELELQNEEAIRARQEAEAASRAKSEFLAVMSHELRSPLNAVIGHTELLQLGIHGAVSDAQGEALARIGRSARHLLGLINDLLNLARIEAGQLDYVLRPVALAETFAAAEAIIGPQAAAKGLALRIAPPPAGLAVRADADKLQQVLVNLLTNAVKFTARGHVTLAAEPDESRGAVRIRVGDTGMGIPADKLEAIFAPFVQVHAGFTREQGGVGLGLAISRDLAEGMGGALSVESEPGQGSTFTVTLPRAELGET